MIGWWVGVAAGASVDLNRASASEIDALPGIGPVKAQAIVEWRTSRGPCNTLADLADVPGIGVATVRMLAGHAHCGAGEPTAADGAGLRSPPIARPVRIDVNRASVSELAELPGITETRAVAIVAERRHGAYTSCADLARVPGIGPATLANLGPTCVALP
jgi:competence protein ComEA